MIANVLTTAKTLALATKKRRLANKPPQFYHKNLNARYFGIRHGMSKKAGVLARCCSGCINEPS